MYVKSYVCGVCMSRGMCVKSVCQEVCVWSVYVKRYVCGVCMSRGMCVECVRQEVCV